MYLTQLTTRSAGWSAVSHLAQAQSALLASPSCAQYNVFLATTLFVQPLNHSFNMTDSHCFLLFSQAVFFLCCLWLRLAFVQSLFLRNLGQQFWRDAQPLDHSFTPIPSPFILPLINQCDRYLVPLAWELMAGECGFASHWGVTLSRSWLCQRCKPLNILGTHLHLATQLLMAGKWEQGSCILPPTSTCYCSPGLKHLQNGFRRAYNW